MANNLGHPNRSCVSCKKRKVKCDRKTPSCAACLKSKHRCHYTSYSPPEDSLVSVPENEEIRQQQLIQNSRMMSDVKLQPPTIIKQSYMLPQQCQPQSSAYINRNLFDSPLQPTSPVSIDNYTLPMRSTITLTYNWNGLLQIMEPTLIPYLQSFTKGAGPALPINGFVNVIQLQNWICEKFIALSQEWKGDSNDQLYVLDPEERLKLRPITDFNQSLQQGSFPERQQFEVTIDRAEYISDEQIQIRDFKTFDDSNSMDIFLNKIYAFVRRFLKDVPWVRENFPLNFRRAPLNTIDFDPCDGLFEVTVEVRKNQSPLFYSQQQNRTIFPINNDMYESQNDVTVKGRFVF
ncbi:5354_t:CDS:2 [Scutellospora calospora]|uniref:5354_t:CDS:1 n=1 Tax=Scutellospora calospora TaxID=85575 RepID=A0ACA9JZI5_9GLOM|nr:5354_t:CDS:2 [Scutellospora calospora]